MTVTLEQLKRRLIMEAGMTALEAERALEYAQRVTGQIEAFVNCLIKIRQPTKPLEENGK